MPTRALNPLNSILAEDLRLLLEQRHHNPGAILGRHLDGAQCTVRIRIPGARAAWLLPSKDPMTRWDDTDLFFWKGPTEHLPVHYTYQWEDESGAVQERTDAYTFPLLLSDEALGQFHHGKHLHVWQMLGAHIQTIDGIRGTLFAVWAPNAERVSVVGDFNDWDGRIHPMHNRGYTGVWELFIPDVSEGCLYKFEIRSRPHSTLLVKTDPYGRAFEMRPGTAARVCGSSMYRWRDSDWMSQRDGWQHKPISIYEVHLGSWRRHADGRFLDYRELADELIPYVQQLGFTHIELLPITEHPLDASWGYQTTGFFAPTSRHGDPDGLREFVDRCHQAGIGVYLDWVPGHFPRDGFGLARFDGSALYEHEDWRRGEHREWGTLVFNYARNEVRGFLISSALYWLEEFHIDGLRVDAVASMLYLDYSRGPGEWLPNRHGGNEHLEAVDFLRELNTVTHREAPGSVTIAEESTAWPQVTRPTYVGGLGFSMKWNMGWMHDTLRYMSKDPIYRHYEHQDLTFGLLYAFSENFVLPFSHDEVVHGKGSMWQKMPGDEWQKMANLRLLYTYMLTYPGKKLLFMGSEMAQPWEWRHDESLPWDQQADPRRQGLMRLLGDLNRLYREWPALHGQDFAADGFSWIDCHDAAQSVIAYRRMCGPDEVVVVLNFTPIPRAGYRVGVPRAGWYREVLNSDAEIYGGSNRGNAGGVASDALPWMDHPHSLSVTLPPLGGIILRHTGSAS
jgi:1,4-alpha-glucan branching enzyme